MVLGGAHTQSAAAPRNRFLKSSCHGMSRFGEKIARLTLLDNPALMQNCNFVCNSRHKAEIVGYEQVREGVCRLQLLQQPHDLSLNRQVKAGKRLVQNQQPGLHAKCPGNGESLPLSAAELVGTPIQPSAGQAHLLHQLFSPRLSFRPG